MEPDAEPIAQGPEPGARRLAAVGVVVSLVLHVAMLGGLRCGSERRPPPVVAIDIETVPLAPEAEELAPEEARPVDPPPAPAPEQPAATEEPELPPPPEDEALLAIDAGVDAEQVAVAPDAGIDAEQVAAVDAGVDDDAGAAVAVAPGGSGGDGGVASDGGVAGDGGDLVATAPAGGDGGILGADPAGNPLARPSAGTKADLIKYFPGGHKVSVMIRLDRLRDTVWADPVEALMRPLPDHGALVADDDHVRASDRFDMLAFSSPEPRSVIATTVVAHTRMAPSALRNFFDAPDAPVAWSVVKGGALGRRGRSKRIHADDPRVFLLWARGWAILTSPADLAGLDAPAAGDLDRAAAAPDALPPWLARLSSIEGEAGHPTGPAIMVTAAGLFARPIPLPIGGGSLPGPESVTITLELDPDGFIIRGNLRYPDEATAATAADTIERVRTEALDDLRTSMALGMVRATNAVKGLTVRRTGRRIAFATSISQADGLALFGLATTLITGKFGEADAAPAAPP